MIGFFEGLTRKQQQPEGDIESRIRLTDERRADLEQRGMIERPPDAERRLLVSGWIARDGSWRRQREVKQALMAGHKPWFRAIG